MSFNILGHYENLHNIINNPVLMNKISMCPTNEDAESSICGTGCNDIYTLGKDDFKCYLTPKDESIIAKQVTYLKNINATIIDMNESNESNVVETLKSTITKEKKLVNAFNLIIIMSIVNKNRFIIKCDNWFLISNTIFIKISIKFAYSITINITTFSDSVCYLVSVNIRNIDIIPIYDCSSKIF